MGSFNVAQAAFSRVFLIEGRAQGNHEPEYQSCARAGSLSKSFGDVERVECPSTLEYNQFEEVAEIRGADARPTSSLMAYFASDLKSRLLELGEARCPVDIQIHFGACTNPRDFNKFTKALVWEKASLTSYDLDDIGALQSDENKKITETTNISMRNFYEVLQLSFALRAPDTVVNAIVDVTICDTRSCGDCDEFSPGTNKIFALQGGITGSPGTAPDIIYSGDKGSTWGSDEITTLLSSETADGIACIDDNVIVVSNASGDLHYKAKATILAGTPAAWTAVATGFVAGGEPNDIWSVGVGAFIVGDGGYVYYTTEPASGVTVLDAGVATSNNLNAVHAIDDKLAVAVGDSDTIIYTTNRTTWAVATVTGGGANLQAVWMKSKKEWWVVDDAGDVYYTIDQGVTWTEKVLPQGASVTALYDIQFVSDSVAYIAGVVSGAGMLWRTYDGGYSWVALPEGSGLLPGSTTRFNALATSPLDVNFLVAGGQTAANDGVLIVGED